MKKYWKIWKQLTACAFSAYFSNKIDSATYFIGKVIRFAFFYIFIISIFTFTDNLVGYGKYEIIFFFLTFNLLDISSQALFRGIYLFKEDIRRGKFDFVISKPVNPLFYSLTRLTDILDLIFLVPVILLITFIFIKLNILILMNAVIYLMFITISLIIILGIHILSSSITIWFIESENFILLYRDLMTVGRFPPEIFPISMSAVLTYFMPIFLITAFPTKAALGLLNLNWAIFAFLYALIFFMFSLLIWKISLKQYSSASS